MCWRDIDKCYEMLNNYFSHALTGKKLPVILSTSFGVFFNCNVSCLISTDHIIHMVINSRSWDELTLCAQKSKKKYIHW